MASGAEKDGCYYKQIYRRDDPPRFYQGMKSYANQLLLTLMTGDVDLTLIDF